MTDSYTQNTYKNADHAKTHPQLIPSPERSSPQIDADFEALMRDGYVIIENLISKEKCQQIKEECMGLLGKTGRNSFEGHKTQRIYDVLSKTRSTDD